MEAGGNNGVVFLWPMPPPRHNHHHHQNRAVMPFPLVYLSCSALYILYLHKVHALLPAYAAFPSLFLSTTWVGSVKDQSFWVAVIPIVCNQWHEMDMRRRQEINLSGLLFICTLNFSSCEEIQYSIV